MPTTNDDRILRRHGDEVQNLPGSYFRALGRCDVSGVIYCVIMVVMYEWWYNRIQ